MSEERSGATTTVGPEAVFHAVVWIGLPFLGATAGAVLAVALDWVVGLSWAPFQGPLTLMDELTGTWTLPALVAAGLVLGLVFALIAQNDAARVTVGADEVVLNQGGDESKVPREAVATVFEEYGRLVLQDVEGRRPGGVLLEDVSVEKVREAFVRHGYDWAEKDPYDQEFARWVTGAPGIHSQADALLAARQEALEKNNGVRSEDFRQELAKLDVVVREDGDRQYWRPAVPRSAAPGSAAPGA